MFLCVLSFLSKIAKLNNSLGLGEQPAGLSDETTENEGGDGRELDEDVDRRA